LAHVIFNLNSAIPGTARECYPQMYEALEGIPGPAVYPA